MLFSSSCFSYMAFHFVFVANRRYDLSIARNDKKKINVFYKNQNICYLNKVLINLFT